MYVIYFDILLTVHLSIFILVINQLDAQNLLYNKFISCLYMFRALCAHRQEVKIVLYSLWYHHTYTCDDTMILYSLWYHHTETSEWSKITKITKITKIQFYKYDQIVVKFMCEFFGCAYCVLLTVNMLWHVEVMFNQLLNLLERYYVYLHLCLMSLSSHTINYCKTNFVHQVD